MFVCEACKLVQPPRTHSNLVVVATRPMVYTFMKYDEDADTEVEATAKGFETVREVKVCKPCATTIDPRLA